jgi:DNA-binding MarR family transcriptional regulator
MSISSDRRGEKWLSALTRPDDPEHHLPPMLLYRLLKLSQLVLRPYYVQRAAGYKLTLNEVRVLMTLAWMEEAASHELCEVAGLHPMNVSRAVASLRSEGQIEERPDENNRRRKLLRLTEAGQRVCEELEPEAARAAAHLFKGIDDEALRNLSVLIDRLTANMISGD